MSLMNYKTAFELLEIDMSDKKYSDINLEYLKKQYHKLALQNHPDKNGNTKESKEKRVSSLSYFLLLFFFGIKTGPLRHQLSSPFLLLRLVQLRVGRCRVRI